MSRTNTEKRQEIERKVVRHLIRTMKSEGWNAINVFDGEETVPTKNEADVLDNVFGVDESRIVFRKAVSPFLPMRRTIRRKNPTPHKPMPARSGHFLSLRGRPGCLRSPAALRYDENQFYTGFCFLDFRTSTMWIPATASRCLLIR